MLNTIKKHIKDGNVFTGVEYITKNNTSKLLCTQLSKKKNELYVLSFFEAATLDKLSDQIKKSQPLFINIHTDQVVSKFISVETDNEQIIVNKAFPNIDVDNFYYEISSFKNITLVSICRKEEVDTILDAIVSKNIEIIGFSLAFHQIQQVETFIENNEIILSNKTLVKSEETISITSKETEMAYNINGIQVESIFLLSFSSALAHFLDNSVPISNFKEKFIYFKNEFYQKRFFNLFSKSLAVVILGVLLSNFLFFNHYFQKVEDLKQTTEINSSNKEKLLKLSDAVNKKEKLVDDIIGTVSSKSSMYLDQVASLLPETLQLTEMNYQPVEKKIKKDQAIVFNNNTLKIEGLAKNSDDFSEWSETLEKLEWVSKLDVTGYGYENNSTSLFKVLIRINDE